jgi:ankyrin repeat protein
MLIDAGANTNAHDSQRSTPLMYAAASGMPSLTELFLEIVTDYHTVNDKNQSALSFVARTNDIHTASFLLGQGLKVDQKSSDNGFTPFLEAVSANKMEMAKFLVENGANATVRDRQGVSAVYFAAKNGNLELLQFLIEKRALIDTPDSYGFTPLMEAILYDRFHIVECLLAAGANPEARTKTNVTLTLFPSWKKYAIPASTTPLELAKILGLTHIVELCSSRT